MMIQTTNHSSARRPVRAWLLGILSFGLIACCTTVNAFAQNPYTIVDMAGRNVTLSGRAERIITTFKPATLSILSLGLADRLVAVDNFSPRVQINTAVCPGISELPKIGNRSTGLNMETVISLKPDLVILYAQKDGILTADRLGRSGIPAIVILPESLDSIKETLRIIARAAGCPERADTVIQAVDDVMDLVHVRTTGLKAQERKTVYYAGPEGFFTTAPGDMLQDEMISQAGGINAAHALTGFFKSISPEQFVQWNPDAVFACREIRSSAGKYLAKPELAEVKAVKSGQFFCIPSSHAPWDFPSPLSVLGVLWAGKRLYPDRFHDIDLIKEIDRFHEILFSRSFTEMGGRLEDTLDP
ncbi:MAG: ABC transporter substrate-binding protein [Desulfobacterales bacterium]|jgi:iron complex transport system substrate-binding protein|nr:ABC transporter substrate-binding protein [Desulfobacterales bacterium]MDD3080687.1 ABC transporter substrate-binding protein [Desulfobacterales bacterium]MDD3949509.1 ABC transporter substrate-binding protein [Desulfobacterales bacterium]MDD4462696.1 ABC transporter substrate-binding protein [Desulfobacterales bacterium]MDY0377273.1 ABC transporter substrate-binding protein [Desulfobacterales bacterium]